MLLRRPLVAAAHLFGALFLVSPSVATAQTVTLAAKVDLAVGNTPTAVAVADLNGDGRRDLVVANNAGNSVSVLLGTGGGAFAPKVDYPTAGPIAVAVGDFNRDGRQDVVAARFGANQAAVFLGVGGGVLGSAVNYATGAGPAAVATADLNNDGRLDLVTANRSATFSILLGTGTGSFGARTDIAAGASPNGLVIEDVTRDGKLDLITANTDLNRVSVAPGNGNGTFGTRGEFVTASQPTDVAVGDINRDGKPDIVASTYFGNTFGAVSVLLGDGSGGFPTHTEYSSGTNPGSVATGDLNGDGLPDLAAITATGNLAILTANGAGAFNSPVVVAAAAGDVVLADVTDDGRIDALVPDNAGTSVALLRNTTTFNAAGLFSTRVDRDTAIEPTISAIADLNRDGKLDLLIQPGQGIDSYVHFGVGNGTFAAGTVAGRTAGPLVLADINRDGKPDLVAIYSGISEIGVQFGVGDGTFAGLQLSPITFFPSDLAVADMNRDGKLDLIATNRESNSVSILAGTGAQVGAAFANQANFPVGERPEQLAVVDINRDGKLDVLVRNSLSNDIVALLGDGNGVLGAGTEVTSQSGISGFAIGDLNADGIIDLVLTNDFAFSGYHHVATLLGTTAGGFTRINGDVPTAQFPSRPVIADVDRDGRTDVVIVSQDLVTVLFGVGDGRLQGRVDYASFAASLAVSDVNADGRPDVVTANASSSVSAYLNSAPPSSDLSATVTGTPGSVVEGARITYTVTVTNIGLELVRGATARLQVPGAVYRAPANCIYDTIVVCTYGNLAAGQSGTAQIEVTAPAPGAVTARATSFGNIVDTNPANDIATVTTIVIAPPPPTSINDTFTTQRNATLTIIAPGVLANDTPAGVATTAQLVTPVSVGTLSLAAEGGFTFTPPADFVGSAVFTYRAQNNGGLGNVATVTINVTALVPSSVNDNFTASSGTPLIVPAPGVLANDNSNGGGTLTAQVVTAPSQGTLALNGNGGFSYTPTLGFVGSDSFTYRAQNTAGSGNTATVTLVVSAGPPTSANDTYTTQRNTTLTIAAPGVLANDTSAAGAMTAQVIAPVNVGTLTLGANGGFTFTPPVDFVGSAAFTYRASNSVGGGNVATVTINVTALLPSAINDTYTATSGTPLTVVAPGILANDNSNGGGALTAQLVTLPARGTLTLSANGGFDYTSAAGYIGLDTFTYRAQNSTGAGNVATVTLVVNAAPPVTVNDTYTVDGGSVLIVDAPGVLANDDNTGGGVLTAQVMTPPANGTLVLNANGGFSYAPNANFVGTDSFTYRALTSAGPGNVATVSLTILASGPQPPTGLYVASISGTTVTLRWTPPQFGPAAQTYSIEGGGTPGSTLGSASTGAAPIFTFQAPAGVLYVRAYTVVDGVKSVASNEVRVAVNSVLPPSPPSHLLGLVNGSSVALAWRNTFEGGAPTSLVLDVTGAITTSLPLGLTDSFSFVAVPAGSYTLTLRAVNAAGSSSASNPISLIFPGPCSGPPLPPERFLATSVGNTATVMWDIASSGPAPTSYLVNVTGPLVATIPVSARSVNGVVGAGTYAFTVTAVNACGNSPPTAIGTIVVP